jgi:hypothetical protein
MGIVRSFSAEIKLIDGIAGIENQRGKVIWDEFLLPASWIRNCAVITGSEADLLTARTQNVSQAAPLSSI